MIHTISNKIIAKSVWVSDIHLGSVGTHIYETLIKLNKRKSGSGNFSRKIKVATKNLLYFIFRYKKCLSDYLNSNRYDGVICGHSHQPKICKLSNKDYFNTGDWIDNCTFLVETNEGEFKLFRWKIN